MSTSRWIVTSLAVAGLLALGAGRVAAQGQGGHMGAAGLEQVLAEMANTPAEHMALAKHYREKAEQAHEEAETHRAMAKTYSASLKPMVAAKQKEHCARLASLYDDMAKTYSELATNEEAAAK